MRLFDLQKNSERKAKSMTKSSQALAIMIGASLLTIWLGNVDILVSFHDFLNSCNWNLLFLELFDIQVEFAALLEHVIENLAQLLDVLFVGLLIVPFSNRRSLCLL